MYAAISQLQSVILANETQCETFKAQFGKFDHLWKKDLSVSLQVSKAFRIMNITDHDFASIIVLLKMLQAVAPGLSPIDPEEHLAFSCLLDQGTAIHPCPSTCMQAVKGLSPHRQAAAYADC